MSEKKLYDIMLCADGVTRSCEVVNGQLPQIRLFLHLCYMYGDKYEFAPYTPLQWGCNIGRTSYLFSCKIDVTAFTFLFPGRIHD